MLVRGLGDIDLAEDSVADAFTTALSGIPSAPGQVMTAEEKIRVQVSIWPVLIRVEGDRAAESGPQK